MNASISTKQLLESIIKEELVLIREETETKKLFSADDIDPLNIRTRSVQFIREVPVKRDRVFVDNTEKRAYKKYRKLVDEYNNIIRQMRPPKDLIASWKHLEPGRREFKGQAQTPAWWSLSKLVKQDLRSLKKQKRTATRYQDYIKKWLGSKSSVTLWDILYTLDGFYAMKRANKAESKAKGPNAWLLGNSSNMWREYYDKIGKWIDPTVRELSMAELAQLQKEWALMSQLAELLSKKGILAIPAALGFIFAYMVHQAVDLSMEMLDIVFPGIKDAWTTWDGFINDETFGIRSLVYTPAGITLTTVLQIIPQTKIPATCIWAILLCDDLKRIGEGNYDGGFVFLDLLFDGLGVISGTAAAAAKLFLGNAALAKIFLNFWKSGGNFTKKLVKPLINWIRKNPKLAQSFKTVIESFVKVGSFFSKAFDEFLSVLKTAATKLPVLKRVFDNLHAIIKVEFANAMQVLNQTINLLKELLMVMKFIFNLPGTRVSILIRLLAQRGLIRSGTLIEKVVVVAFNMLWTITLLDEIILDVQKALTPPPPTADEIIQEIEKAQTKIDANLNDKEFEDKSEAEVINITAQKALGSPEKVNFAQNMSRTYYKIKPGYADSVLVNPTGYDINRRDSEVDTSYTNNLVPMIGNKSNLIEDYVFQLVEVTDSLSIQDADALQDYGINIKPGVTYLLKIEPTWGQIVDKESGDVEWTKWGYIVNKNYVTKHTNAYSKQ